MGDFKSKLPDLKDVVHITGKLFKDIKTSVDEIISDYKKRHEQTEKSDAAAPKEPKPAATKKEASKDKE